MYNALLAEINNNNLILVERNQINGASEWLLFNTNPAICQLYHGEDKLIFSEMMMRSALY